MKFHPKIKNKYGYYFKFKIINDNQKFKKEKIKKSCQFNLIGEAKLKLNE